MRPTAATILISGAGQLGSRYLQGLAKCRVPLSIYVQDIYPESLTRAKQRWDEISGEETRHEVSFHSSFESLPQQVNIAIVATNADVRPQVVCDIAKRFTVRFWVLEKVLAQSESGLDEIMVHIKKGSAWVNTRRRIMPWYQQIGAHFGRDHPMSLKLEGGAWGLACNAIHFLDLFSWWTGETLQDICTDNLKLAWFEGKRPGNWEVLGTLEARFSKGSHMFLSAREDDAPLSLEVNDGNLVWLIQEAEGLAKRSDGIEIPGRISHQSETTGALVESILEDGCCGLPSLEESVALHRIFIRNMLAHWNRTGGRASTFVPIT